MYHVELRQFPHQARAFNLTRQELDARILEPWTVGSAIHLQDRRWTSEKAKLTILEGDELRPDEIGMGRGWSNATKGGIPASTRIYTVAPDGKTMIETAGYIGEGGKPVMRTNYFKRIR